MLALTSNFGNKTLDFQFDLNRWKITCSPHFEHVLSVLQIRDKFFFFCDTFCDVKQFAFFVRCSSNRNLFGAHEGDIIRDNWSRIKHCIAAKIYIFPKSNMPHAYILCSLLTEHLHRNQCGHFKWNKIKYNSHYLAGEIFRNAYHFVPTHFVKVFNYLKRIIYKRIHKINRTWHGLSVQFCCNKSSRSRLFLNAIVKVHVIAARISYNDMISNQMKWQTVDCDHFHCQL